MATQRKKSWRRRVRESRRAFRSLLLSALTRPLVSLLGALSPTRGQWLARCLSAWAVRCHASSLQIAEQNLAVAFPELTAAERQELARKSFEHSVLMFLETTRILKHPDAIGDMLLPMEKTFIQDISSAATIVCIPHLGNWEILAQAFPLQGVTCSAVAETLNNKVLDKLITQTREHNGLKIILRTGAARKVLGALRQKEAVGLLVDQNLSPQEGGVFADFFGLPASTVPLPALLARKLNVQVKVIASVRTEAGTYKVIHQPLSKPIADYDSDQELTQDITSAFQKMIATYPEQYTWSYKRWRYLPDNVPESLRRKFPDYAQLKPYELQPELLERLFGKTP